MARGSLIAPLFGGSKPSNSNSDRDTADLSRSQTTTDPSSRMSSSYVFPVLTRLDTNTADAADPAPPSSRTFSSLRNRSSTTSGLVEGSSSSVARQGGDQGVLTLKFTGPSFLDVVIKDAQSKDPVYIIETIRDCTNVYRLLSEARRAEKVATVQWPATQSKGKGKTGRMVQMGEGRWRDAEEFLKYGALNNYALRRFNIPHYPNALKWKLVPGNSYYCSTSSIKSPIAVLDPAVLSAPPRLRVFDTSLNGDAERTQANYRGVPTMLLDYLVTTALLLVTEVQEWLDRPQTESGKVPIPGSKYPVVRKWLAIIHGESIPESLGTPPPKADWDTQSTRSGGSVSAPASTISSSIGDPFTPLTPATTHSFLPRLDELPPMPPVPPVATPHMSVRHLPETSTQPHYLTVMSNASSSTFTSPAPSLFQSSPPPPPIPVTKTSFPNTPAGPRPLPKPPVTPASASSFSSRRPWTSDGYASGGGSPSTSSSSPLMTFSRSPSASVARTPSPSSASSSTTDSPRSRGARSSLGRSLTVANMQPPPPPTPPFPPKLAQELSGSHYERSMDAMAAHAQTQTQAQAYADGSRRFSNGQPPPPPPLGYAHPQQLESPPHLVEAPAYPYAQTPQPQTQMQMQMQMQMHELAQGMHTMSVGRPRTPAGIDAHAHVHAVLYSPHMAPMQDAGMVAMLEAHASAGARDSYAETIFEQPPPAYDAIDWSLPQVSLPAHGRVQR